MSLAVHLLVLELCCTLLAYLLVLPAVGLLAVHAAVLDEAAGIAVLQVHRLAPVLAAVGTGSVTVTVIYAARRALHNEFEDGLREWLSLREKNRFPCV